MIYFRFKRCCNSLRQLPLSGLFSCLPFPFVFQRNKFCCQNLSIVQKTALYYNLTKHRKQSLYLLIRNTVKICTQRRDSQDFPSPSWVANSFKILTISILIVRDWCLCSWYDFSSHGNIFPALPFSLILLYHQFYLSFGYYVNRVEFLFEVSAVFQYPWIPIQSFLYVNDFIGDPTVLIGLAYTVYHVSTSYPFPF